MSPGSPWQPRPWESLAASWPRGAQGSALAPAIPGSTCLLLALPGSSWPFLALPGPSWLLLAPPGSSWFLLALPGSSWLLIALPGLLAPTWLLLALAGSSWLPLASPGEPGCFPEKMVLCSSNWSGGGLRPQKAVSHLHSISGRHPRRTREWISRAPWQSSGFSLGLPGPAWVPP